MNIACIDFETANHSRVSMCAASVAVFQDGELIESPYWLVKPPKGHGWFKPEWTENCHGLSWFDVKDAPEFAAIAPAFLALLTKADIVVAHRPGWVAPQDGALGALLAQHRDDSVGSVQGSVSGRIVVTPVTQLEISSTSLRSGLARGGDPRYLVPDGVREIIARSGCYR